MRERKERERKERKTNTVEVSIGSGILVGRATE